MKAYRSGAKGDSKGKGKAVGKGFKYKGGKGLDRKGKGKGFGKVNEFNAIECWSCGGPHRQFERPYMVGKGNYTNYDNQFANMPQPVNSFQAMQHPGMMQSNTSNGPFIENLANMIEAPMKPMKTKVITPTKVSNAFTQLEVTDENFPRLNSYTIEKEQERMIYQIKAEKVCIKADKICIERKAAKKKCKKNRRANRHSDSKIAESVQTDTGAADTQIQPEQTCAHSTDSCIQLKDTRGKGDEGNPSSPKFNSRFPLEHSRQVMKKSVDDSEKNETTNVSIMKSMSGEGNPSPPGAETTEIKLNSVSPASEVVLSSVDSTTGGKSNEQRATGAGHHSGVGHYIIDPPAIFSGRGTTWREVSVDGPMADSALRAGHDASSNKNPAKPAADLPADLTADLQPPKPLENGETKEDGKSNEAGIAINEKIDQNKRTTIANFEIGLNKVPEIDRKIDESRDQEVENTNENFNKCKGKTIEKLSKIFYSSRLKHFWSFKISVPRRVGVKMKNYQIYFYYGENKIFVFHI